jgi:hypothetical protein
MKMDNKVKVKKAKSVKTPISTTPIIEDATVSEIVIEQEEQWDLVKGIGDLTEEQINKFLAKSDTVHTSNEVEDTEEELTEEEKAIINNNIGKKLLEDACIFLQVEEKLSKEKEEEDLKKKLIAENIELKKMLEKSGKLAKIKQYKPVSVKMDGFTYEKIKKHCKDHNLVIEDWLDTIALNEVNRIITRFGDIQYSK